MQITLVVDIRKPIDNKLSLNWFEKVLYREHAMRIKFDALRTDGSRKVKSSARLHHCGQILQSNHIAVVVDGVAIPPQSKMLECMQAG